MPQLVLLPLRLMNLLMMIICLEWRGRRQLQPEKEPEPETELELELALGAAFGHLSLRCALRFEGFLMDSSVESA